MFGSPTYWPDEQGQPDISRTNTGQEAHVKYAGEELEPRETGKKIISYNWA